MLCALISDQNSVTGIVQIDDSSQAQMFASIYSQVIDITDTQPQPQIGWTFDGTNIVGTSVSKKITKLAMRQRFTVSEMLGVMTASSTIPIVKYLMDNLAIATYVDLSRTDTQAGIAVLVQYGLLTQERATTILTTAVSPVEEYKP